MKKFVPILVIFLASSLIFLYFKGDYDSAMKLADQGNVEAQLRVGICNFKKGDYESAMKLLTPAAEQGNTEAQLVLGRCFVWKRDYASAVKWLKPLAEQGNTEAQLWLGLCFFRKGDHFTLVHRISVSPNEINFNLFGIYTYIYYIAV